MGVTVEALIGAGIPADEIVTRPASDGPADTWPLGLKRGPARTVPAAVVAARSAETVGSVLRVAAASGATVQVEGTRTNVVGCLDGRPDVVLRLAMDRIVDFDAASQVVTAQAGVVGGASLAVARLMPEVKLNGLVPDFATGLEVQREFIQRALPVGVARLLNPAETAAVLTDTPDRADTCLSVLSLVGEPDTTEIAQRTAAGVIGAAGGTVLSPGAADHWWDNRHAGPELVEGLNRDPGSFFDTIELGVVWRSAAALASALQSEVGELADRLWMHSSHIYSTGTGLYLAFWIDDSDDDSACARAEAVWALALDLADIHGGTIGHHHGIGAVRSARYISSIEGRLHRSVKQALDPTGVMAARLLDG